MFLHSTISGWIRLLFFLLKYTLIPPGNEIPGPCTAAPNPAKKASIKLKLERNCWKATNPRGEMVTKLTSSSLVVKATGELGREQRNRIRSGVARKRVQRIARSKGEAGWPSERRRDRRCHALFNCEFEFKSRLEVTSVIGLTVASWFSGGWVGIRMVEEGRLGREEGCRRFAEMGTTRKSRGYVLFSGFEIWHVRISRHFHSLNLVSKLEFFVKGKYFLL